MARTYPRTLENYTASRTTSHTSLVGLSATPTILTSYLFRPLKQISLPSAQVAAAGLDPTEGHCACFDAERRLGRGK